jgi:hypothetical protein
VRFNDDKMTMAQFVSLLMSAGVVCAKVEKEPPATVPVPTNAEKDCIKTRGKGKCFSKNWRSWNETVGHILSTVDQRSLMTVTFAKKRNDYCRGWTQERWQEVFNENKVEFHYKFVKQSLVEMRANEPGYIERRIVREKMEMHRSDNAQFSHPGKGWKKVNSLNVD